ncbi:MAG TPA: tetratricopeptide repeat protein [Vicinamibacterales bacterium]|nr:tetratricopeptide repeat protein [Vicinamibacterales bacterium]
MSTSRFAIAVGRAQGSDPARPLESAVFSGTAAEDGTAGSWPFRRHVTPSGPAPPPRIRLLGLHRAFPAGQTSGTRLVLTQATYQLQRWLDWLNEHPSVVVLGDCTAAPPAMAREAFAQRGPWARIAVEAVPPAAADAARDAEPSDPFDPLRVAFDHGTAEDRWRHSRRLSYDYPSHPALHLAHASACMELLRLDDAHAAIEHALSLAPEWEAVHFELGKLWLRSDDTERAAAAFAEAGRLMPSFSAAFSNLGAALGELERHEEALDALKQALRFDPFGHAILNNIGAAARDLGRLDEAETAFRQALTHAPTFVFAHYNLGHTCFLQGRFAEARDAYEAGLAADPRPGPRQRCRAALAHAASGDPARAQAYFEQALEGTEAEAREELVNESAAVLDALAKMPGADAPGLTRLIERLYS